ncbi:LolA family protein [Subtercola boreus]|uniref:DUF2092 domain-containing protein n=1 Tax=Subtercola boreus TaxID=120213 RepID=A0A3E0W7E8_9MICO|nr:DUF2092 domain-containing protein [Subtercola boreus]RFA19015.1 hypothetical protein B7R24_12810 [Subtercola boreus]RFA19153.1 hypothetical protein B7R23_12790 [Subtercola boreus]RFA25615.1 hypothetical protein B7R25_12910 [Subtercola boreus]
MAQVWKRWIPAAVGVVVVAGVAATVPLAANASAGLPTKSAQDVLALAANSSVSAFSGTVEQTSDLGLPSLPAGVGSSSSGSSGSGSGSTDSASDGSAAVSSALELLTGTHTARVFVDGPSNLRVQVLDQLAERDVVKQGDSLWLYDSSKQTAVHATAAKPAQDALPTSPEQTATPEQLAQKFLDAVDPTTVVSVGGDVTVAGRSAYDLVLTPQVTDSLVGAVSIAVDSETGLALRVEVTARGAADPAFSTAFTDLSLAIPSADLFSFTPPAGTTITEKTVTEKTAPTAADGSSAAAPHKTPDNDSATDAVPADAKPIVTGTGWSSIVELPAGSDTQALTSSPLLSQLTTAVDGGHLLSTTLVNVFVASDGRVFAGSVSAEALEAAAVQ